MRNGSMMAGLLCGAAMLAACTPMTSPPAPPAPPPAAPPAPMPAPMPAAPAPGPAPRAPAPVPQASNDGLPDGPGKAETVAGCSGCHGLGQIMGEHRDRAAWTTTVTSMINNGAPVPDADFDKVVTYLTAHFGP